MQLIRKRPDATEEHRLAGTPDKDLYGGVAMHTKSLCVRRSMRARALWLREQDQATDRIVEAIRRALTRKVWLREAVAEGNLQRAVGTRSPDAARSPIDGLADRELNVFRHVGERVRTAEIATKLHSSFKTVETCRNRIRQKLDLSNRTELVHVATEWVLANG